MIPVPAGPFSIKLETTIYRPPGAGPFPLAVINHGKAAGDPRFQERFRATSAARYFLERGYLVVVPMRSGFARSGGSYNGAGCNVESNGRLQAEDVAGIVAHFAAQPEVDRSRIVVVGQSHGGWTALAYGAEQPAAGVRGLVNFAGGLRQDNCTDWTGALARAAAGYGEDTRLPSLWLYGDNDSYFPPEVFRAMFERYRTGGGTARLVAYGRFGTDAHALFSAAHGRAVWQPYVDEFLQSIGLPVAVVNSQYVPAPPLPAPAASGFALLEAVQAVPHLGDKGRDAYRQFLDKSLPRAFAISAEGHWGWATEGEDPLRRALGHCQKNARSACRLYAVDQEVVWSIK
jgi:dienelactone hydrolase